MLARTLCGVGLLAAALLVTAPASGQDSDATRFYLGLRLGTQFAADASVAEGLSATQFQDIHGVSLGVNLGRYVGVELAADQWEPNLRRSHAIAEHGVGIVVPQIRLRYPLLEGRLVPYLIGGVGVAFTELNDRKADAFGRRMRGNDTGVVGAAGAGIEYFVAGNIAVGVESRGVVGSKHDFELDGVSRPVTIDAVLTSVSLRVFVDDPAAAPAGVAGVGGEPRANLDIRVGVARPIDRHVSRDLELRPEGAAIGSLSQLFGFGVGVDLTPRWALYLSAEGFESFLAVRDVGSVGEYAVYVMMPQVRMRHAVWEGRLVPYALAGVGASYAEANDTKPRGARVKVEGKGFGIAAEAGLGIDYFVARNIAFGLEAKYLYSRDQTLEVAGARQTLNLDSVLATLGLRLVFP